MKDIVLHSIFTAALLLCSLVVHNVKISYDFKMLIYMYRFVFNYKIMCFCTKTLLHDVLRRRNNRIYDFNKKSMVIKF